MKHNQKKQRKLTLANYRDMWGEEGPYSQVRLCEETRILDDSVSRIFLVVEAEINPFTFEWAQENRERFLDDGPILQLLDYAENRGERGYVVSAGEVKLDEESSRQFARTQTEVTIQTLIRLHACVIHEFGLRKGKKLGIITDNGPAEVKHIWNDELGGVEVVDKEIWSSETLIDSPAGIINNKIRFFFVLAFVSDFDFKKTIVTKCMESLTKVATRFSVQVEDCESFFEYILLTTLIPMDVAPADFIESVLDEWNHAGKRASFQKDYLVTNVKKPTQEQVLIFLKQLPLDKDMPMH